MPALPASGSVLPRFRPSTNVVLALLVALLAVAGQFVSHRVSSGVLEASVRQREIDKIDTIGNLISGLIAREGSQIRVVARLLASDDVLEMALAEKEPKKSANLKSKLDEVFKVGGVQILEVTDTDEIVLYRAQDPASTRQQATGWGVAEALAGTGMLVSARGRDGISIRAIEPIRRQGAIIGTISAGVMLDRAFVDRLSGEAGAKLAILGRQGVVLGDKSARVDWIETEAMNEAFLRKVPVYRVDTASRLTSVYLPINIVDDAYVVLAQLDSRAAYALIDEGKRRSALYAIATLIGSVLVGLLVLRIALGPLRKLRARAEQTVKSLTGEAIEVSARDDVASVVTVLDTLTDRLVARNSELAVAKTEADAASEAKSRFLSTMSHEIRTPLNGVLGLTELLQRTQLDSEQSRFVGAIHSAGRALHDLLGDILDLSKIEEGQVVLERVDFDVRRLALDVADVYREIAATRGLAMVIDIDHAGWSWVCGDPTRFRQIISNLLGNAIKFTAKGEVRLLGAATAPRDGDARVWWRFTIEDTGTGIAPEAMTQLFQRFTQADTSTTRNYGGSGLGLALCKHMVELMGGRIQAQSVQGEGARFWFDIPLDRATSQRPPPRAAPIDTQVASGTGVRVLVAEDNAINQLVVGKMLSKLGATVKIVDNGEIAIEQRKNAAFDVILMDCLMPVMDGFDATRHIRAWEHADPARGSVPIIALTANVLAGDREACLAAGMTGYLAKPFTLAGLAQAIGSHLSPAQPPSQPPTQAERPSPRGETEITVPDFDPSVILALSNAADGSEPAFADQLYDLFLGGTETILTTIDQAVRDGQSPVLLRAVHTLSASAARVGALKLASEAERMQLLLRNGSAFEPGWAVKLRSEFERAANALAKYRAAKTPK
jgi:signal transduction histidine kinase/CheY-like chemotaxis protein/HPt (histidine-containing phosphotransfer) domain-containing protein